MSYLCLDSHPAGSLGAGHSPSLPKPNCQPLHKREHAASWFQDFAAFVVFILAHLFLCGGKLRCLGTHHSPGPSPRRRTASAPSCSPAAAATRRCARGGGLAVAASVGARALVLTCRLIAHICIALAQRAGINVDALDCIAAQGNPRVGIQTCV